MRDKIIEDEAFNEVRGMLNVLGIRLTKDGPAMDLDGEAEIVMTEDGPQIRLYNITE